MNFAVIYTAFDDKQKEKRKAIESRPLFSKASASTSGTPKFEGPLSRRAEIKHKLGLHLNSPRVEQALSSPSIKGLVKNVRRTVKHTGTTDSSAESSELECGGVKNSDDKRDLKNETHKVNSFGRESSSPTSPSSCENKDSGRLEDGEKLQAFSASANSVGKDGIENESGMNSLRSEGDGATNHRETWGVNDEKTGLATLMANYSDSDSNSSES